MNRAAQAPALSSVEVAAPPVPKIDHYFEDQGGASIKYSRGVRLS
jgi:hypothetical protein